MKGKAEGPGSRSCPVGVGHSIRSVSARMLQTEPTGFPARVDVAGAEREESRMTPRLWSEGVGAGLLLVELGRAVGGAGLEEKSKGSLEPRDVTGIRVELNHWPVHT